MPIKECILPGGGKGYQWGEHGKCYPDRKQAEAQAAAARANGFSGDHFMAHDKISITKNRTYTDEGFLVIKNCTLARTGIQNYRAFELGLDKALGIPPQQIVKLYRPHEEVFAPDSLASFENKPLTIDHPDSAVTAKNWNNLAKGEGRDIKAVGDFMKGTLVIKSSDAIQSVESGKVEISNGYLFDLDLTPGITVDNGERYDGVQRNIRGNHIAIVDKARCGSACRVGDSFFNSDNDNEGDDMAATTEPLRKIVVDGIPIEVNDSAAAVIEKLEKQLIAAKDETAKITKQMTDSLAALTTEKDKEIGELRTQVMTPEARDAMVGEWSAILMDAKELMPDLQTKGLTCDAIRRKMLETGCAKDASIKGVVDAIVKPSGKAIADAPDTIIKVAYDAMKALKPAKKNETSNQGGESFGRDFLNAGNDQGEVAMVGRDAMIFASQNAWRGDSKDRKAN